ncbi:hypothetical protein M9H77_21060 [Catharanthus roseus]|uniref:Uncharacterized protein n=1 Tax=Catharanthus roseus TaxID=4058 RepID=A0ACC0AL90_CATRO|nr:hypothetical protein M9H77_21060 [Catharanthus roseus]
MRDHNGQIPRPCASCTQASESFSAEPFAATQALKKADTRNIKMMILEGDAINVLRALRGNRNAEDWRGRAFIEEGQTFFSRRIFWKVAYVHRSGNHDSHNLTKWAYQSIM